MGRLNVLKVTLALLSLTAHPVTHPDLSVAFYVPGVAPVEFLKNARIDIRAIKITSVVTQLPYDFYSLPICAPAGDIYYKSENLGEVLRGDRIVNTAYEVKMAQDETCRLLCKNTTALTVEQTNRLISNIKEEYQVHLLADNLPSATKLHVPATGEQIYEHGHKLGFLNDKNEVFLNNHLNIKMFYHEHVENENKYRIVGFEVEPRSIGNDAYKLGDANTCNEVPKEGQPLQRLEEGKESKIMWSYSVKWERSQIKWASRWDTYLAMKDVQIHWFSILNSIVVVICLSGFLSIIIIRAVRRDIAHYNRDEDYDETLEETGWKLVHGDVFRPPPNAKLLTSLTGTGIQIFAVSLTTLCFAMLGMLSPSSRGSLMTVALFLFCFFGLIAGYFAGRLYKTMRGVQWKRGAMQTGLLYPGMVAGTCLLLNFFIWGKHSSGAVPFSTMIALCAMWFGISLPLVMIGFYFGFRKQPYQHPVRTNQIPRQVPEQPWYLHSIPCMLLSGILPFGAMFIELFFIFTAIWEHEFYYMFGFLFIVFLILVVTVAQISIVVTYFQLCAENYHWWWKSYLVSGGSAFYVIVYSIFYYWTKLEIAGFVPSLLYFGYSFLIGLTFWLFSGTVGFYASYFFVCKIYGSVKID